jgi:predicted ATPase
VGPYEFRLAIEQKHSPAWQSTACGKGGGLKDIGFDRLFVITGGPGSGKSTLIDALAGHGIFSMPEAGRSILQDQVAIGGEALPWFALVGSAGFRRTDVKLGNTIVSGCAEARGGHVISDRGVPDVAG